MTTRRALYAACAAVAILAGCATNQKFQTKMDGLVGSSEATLVGMYGPPQGMYQLGDGSRVLQYTRGGTLMLQGAPTTTPVVTNTAGNMTMTQGYRQVTANYSQTSTTMAPTPAPQIPVQLWCTVNFTLSTSGTVTAWRAEGNHCVAN